MSPPARSPRAWGWACATPTTSASAPASPRSWTAARSASPTWASSRPTSCPGPTPGSSRWSKPAATDLGVPLMVHIGDRAASDEASAARRAELTRFVLRTFEPGDILTHLCTPNAGRVLDSDGDPYPEVGEARANGVVLDSALGRGNFGIEVARRQADLGLYPDTISSDLTAGGRTFHSLLECMAKFMSIGYSLADVVAAATGSAAAALGREDELGAIAIGRDADLSVIDVVEGDFTFTDTTGQAFRGGYGLVPVRTLKAGEEFSPGWGTHPWGWLPAPAGDGA